ncbi:amidohydrolase [Maribacter sp. 2-571]|uniref:amidohydrolase n=1 Tax=Maribacter sp. 2-571 TaxID=3417569 RepID=UPI003D33F8C0
MKSTLLCSLVILLSISCKDGTSQTNKNSEDSGQETADLIITNGRIAIMDKSRSTVEAIAIKDGLISGVGTTAALQDFKGENTQIIDVKGKTVIPGLNDSHLHLTRGGRFYNAELRWDGVKTLKRALEMLKEQAERTPDGQWVRVIGGWSPYQFEENRFPTPEEINEATGDVPTYVLFLYSRGWLNQAALKELQIDETTKAPEGSTFEKGEDGKLTGVLLAEPNPGILYARIGALPPLNEDQMVNSTKQFYRELNRLGVTSGIDAGGGGHKFPKDYSGTKVLAEDGEMPIRLSYYLFPQNKGEEFQEFETWMDNNTIFHDGALHLDHGYELEGGGEFLVWSAGDFENFLAPQPMLKDRKNWRPELKKIVTLLVNKKWPFRIHATYGETIAQFLDVFEEVNKETNNGFSNIRWAIDHAETVTEEQLQRIKDLNGGVAVQARMAYAGEFFVERYGKEKAAQAPPVRKILDMEIPIGAGTDGTRVASYNPWPALHWLVSGKTVGGLQYMEAGNRMSREEALHLYTKGSAWFSQEEDVKGTLEKGMYADFAVLSDDYFNIPESEINNLHSVLTVTNGKVVYAANEFENLNPELPEVLPEWSPVKYFGGYQDN